MSVTSGFVFSRNDIPHEVRVAHHRSLVACAGQPFSGLSSSTARGRIGRRGRGKWIGYGGYSTGAVDRRQRIEEGSVWFEAETPLTHECAGGVLWGGVSRGEVVE